jgi:hypothetical protein
LFSIAFAQGLITKINKKKKRFSQIKPSFGRYDGIGYTGISPARTQTTNKGHTQNKGVLDKMILVYII